MIRIPAKWVGTGAVFWAWGGVGLAPACTSEPVPAHSPAVPSAAQPQAEALRPVSSARLSPNTPALRLRLDPVESPTLGKPWRLAFHAPSEGVSLSPEAALEQRIEVTGAVIDDRTQLWLKLDSHVPRRMNSGVTLTLGQMLDELGGIEPGMHRLLAYASISDGRVLVNAAKQPFVSSVAFEVTDAHGAHSARAEAAFAVLLSPVGTLYGPAELNSAYLQVGAHPAAERLRLRIVAPGGSVDDREIAPGCYQLGAFVSGDYRFYVYLPGSAPSSASSVGNGVLTVNLEQGEP